MRDERPTPFPALVGDHDDSSELGWLRRAEAHGVPIAPMAVLPAPVEAAFYRWNNLPARLERLLAEIDVRDPDEDDLDELLPAAAAWVLEHALLDEVVDAFYGALVGLPTRVSVRRPGADGSVADRGRPALLAVKRTWAADWALPAVMRRVEAGGGWLPAARPVLVHAADLRVDPEVAAAAAAAAGRPVTAWSDAEGRVARLTVA